MSSPGWKFSPSDEQVFTHYLIPKTHGHDTEPIVIGEVKFYQFEPWDLPDLCKIKSNVSVWHFFCPLEFKDPGRRVRNRKTRAGFWKSTGNPKPVYAKGTNKKIGSRTTLVFHQGTFKKNIKTNWYTYEYELITKGDLVLCKVELKPSKETSKRQPRKLQKTRKGPVSEQVPSSSSLDFEGESSSLTNNTSKLMNESPYVESEETDPAIFISVNHMTRELSANSACTEIRPGQVLASGSENLHLGQMVVSSVHGDAERMHQMDSDFGNQNSDSVTNYGETCDLTTSDFENQDQDNDVLGILDFGNQNQDEIIYNSVFSEGERNFLMGRPLSSCDEGEARSLMASDLGNHERDSNMSGFFIKTSIKVASDIGDHNNGKNNDILAFEEGQCTSFLDFEDKNPCKMTEMLTPEDSSWLSYLTDYLLEEDEVEDFSRKINPLPMGEQVAELESLVAEAFLPDYQLYHDKMVIPIPELHFPSKIFLKESLQPSKSRLY